MVSPWSAYEKPTPMGWSKNIMFAFVFHAYGLNNVLFADSMSQGPAEASLGTIHARAR